MVLDSEKLLILKEYGLEILGHSRNVAENLFCELPCSLKHVEIGESVKFGAFSYMVSGHIFATSVGRYCSIGEDVQIGRQNHPMDWVSTSPFFYLPSKDIIPVTEKNEYMLRGAYYQHGATPTKIKFTDIGHDVWIGHGAIINAGVKIGNGAIIAAGSVVTKEVLPYTIVGGNPAKFIRFRILEEYIEDLEKTEWWEFTPKQLEQFSMHDIEKFINDFNQAKLEKQNFNKILLANFTF